MPSVRTGQFILWGLGSMALAGCGGLEGLQADPAHPIDLSGSWVLDRPASDDPQKIIDQLRPKGGNRPGDVSDDGTTQDEDNGQSAAGQAPTGGPPRGGGRRGRSQRTDNDAPIVYRDSDASTHGAVTKTLLSNLARGGQLTVHQSADLFAIDYGTSVRTFTPGGKSVVSADWGVADQVSGWKGKEFVIEVKPQSGVATVEKYGLSEDGKHLIEQLRVGGSGYPAVELKRVYDHTDQPLPRAYPKND